MDPESTHHCGSGITSVDMFSASVPLFTACGTTPGTRTGTPLRNALDTRDQVYADLAHYEDRAAVLTGSTDAMSALPRCLHKSIATSSLGDVDWYARHLKRAYRLLQQEIAMPAMGAEVRQA